MDKKMEFISEKKDYNAAEFYKKFHKHLPKLVTVTHGFYGDICEETFDKGEVLVIGVVSEQRRVLTRVRSGAGKFRLLSIPSSYHEKFCVVSEDRENVTDSYLCNILIDNKLPFTVQFPMNRIITIGPKTLSTNYIPKMELLETFDEKYLLGNRVVDGVVGDAEDILHIPLYLSQLRMSVACGIKDQSKHQWKKFLQDLEHKTEDIQYDMEYGNPNIAEYKQDGIHTVKEYSFEEPEVYENIINIIQRWPECRPKNVSETTRHFANTHNKHTDGDLSADAYETVEVKPPEESGDKPKDVKDAPQKGAPQKGAPQETDKHDAASAPQKGAPQKGAPQETDKHDAASAPQKDAPQIGAPQETNKHDAASAPQKDAPQIGAPQETNKHDAAPAPQKGAPHETYKPDAAPPPLPYKKPGLGKINKTNVSKSVTKTKSYVKADTKCKKHLQKPMESRRLPCPVGLPKKIRNTPHKVRSKNEVMLYTCHEVLDYLKELDLGQYVGIFHKNLVDGKLLINMDRTLLKEEFGMTGEEIQKLFSFTETTDDKQGTDRSGGLYTDLIVVEEISHKEEPHIETNSEENVYEIIENPDAYEDIGSPKCTEDTAEHRDKSTMDSLNKKEVTGTGRDTQDPEKSKHILKQNVRPVHKKANQSDSTTKSKVGFENVEANVTDSTGAYVRLAPNQSALPESQKPVVHKCVNNIPSTRVAPVIKSSQALKCTADQTSQASHSSSGNDDHADGNITRAHGYLSEDDISELSTQEVCLYLRKLNLQQFEESFEKQMVDGAMLIELDKEILVQEFGMKKVEAMRLLKFAKEGRLPKST